MESRIQLVAFCQHVFAGLEEVDERWVGLQQVLGVLQVNAADGDVFLPVLKSLRDQSIVTLISLSLLDAGLLK